jgi:polyphosphate kinase
VAPLNLGRNCVSLIDREAAHARAGRPAFIVAKVNSLLDKKIIQALYEASQAGVDIELIVRGGCALRPGIRGISSRIRVRSIVGRFLEHSRIFFFANGGQPEVYLGSADWMPRNLYERVEVMFRLKDPALCQQVCSMVLAPYLADTVKARLLLSDGTYSRAHRSAGVSRSRNGARFSVQEYFMGLSEAQEGENGFHPLPQNLKMRNSAIIEILSKPWQQEHNA